MIPIEELKPHLDNTVCVRVMNALIWAGIKYVEELNDQNKMQAFLKSKNIGRQSIRSLEGAMATVMKLRGREMMTDSNKLINVFYAMQLEQCSSNDEEYSITFEIRLKDKMPIKFQSHPMRQDHAMDMMKALSDWAQTYNKLRKKTGILFDMLKQHRRLVQRFENEIKP